MIMWKSSQWLGKNIIHSIGFLELQESMDRCIGPHDRTEILLKAALNTIQSIQCGPCLTLSQMTIFLDSFKLKDFADDNFSFDKNGRKFTKWVENTVGK